MLFHRSGSEQSYPIGSLIITEKQRLTSSNRATIGYTYLEQHKLHKKPISLT